MKAAVLLTLLMLMGCNATIAKKKSAAPMSAVPLTAEESATAARVSEVGKEIFARDIRTAEASDLLLERIYPGNYPNFVGWVAYPNQEDYTVSFYEKNPEQVSIIADVIYDKNGIPEISIEPKREPSQTEISMLNARLAALENGVNSCSHHFNTVVVPGENEEEWDVFILAANMDPHAVQIGGHTKVSVSKATPTITRTTPLSKSCLVINKIGGDVPEGAEIHMLTVSHVLSAYPAETHAYLSLLHAIPFAVITERGVWLVKDGNIEFAPKTKSGER